MHTTAFRLVAGAIGAVLLLSGCGGENPKPQPLPKPTASTSPSASASPPVMPAAAKSKTDRAVEAFARHYVEVINYATATGDRRELDALATRRCASCKRLADRLDQIYSAGGSIESKGWRVHGADVVPRQPLNRKYVDLAIVQSPQILVEKAAAKPQRFPGGKQALTMLIARRGESWAVTRMSLAG